MQKQTLKKIGAGATIIVAMLIGGKMIVDAPSFYRNQFPPKGQFSEPPTSKHLPKSAGASAFDSFKIKADTINKK
jgi:hypothetical protein